MSPEEQAKILTRGAVDVVSEEELIEKLRRGRPLRVKYGADPSAPDLHLGHSVPLRALRRFQDLGHHIIFIIGDFTGRIGDPSGRTKTRPMLSEEEIKRNAETYAAQVGKILDVSRCEVVYNSAWFEELGAAGLLELARHYTVARMLERIEFPALHGLRYSVYFFCVIVREQQHVLGYQVVGYGHKLAKHFLGWLSDADVIAERLAHLLLAVSAN